MSSDTLRISHQPQPAPASTAGEEAPKPPKGFARLRHRVETYRGDGFRCVYCGKDLLADSDSLLLATVDHIVAQAVGGGDGQANRATCCWACNRLKGGTRVTSIEQGRRVIAQRREEELARFHAALGDLSPPRSPELVALTAAAARWDARTLAGQALRLTLLTRQQARQLGKLACSLRQWANALQDLRSEPSATRVEPRRLLWHWLRRLVG